jgi:hydroxypyruvate isomerase
MTGLRFCANVGFLFTELPYEQRFDAAARAGFTAVEHSDPYVLPAGRVRELLDAAGLQQALLNSPVGTAGTPAAGGWGCLPGEVQRFRASVGLALEYATVLGAPLVHLRAGIRPPELPRDAALARLVTNVGWAAEQAQAAGVRLTLEALNPRDVPGYVLDNQELAGAIASAVGPERVGVQFDVYHCQVAQGDVTTRLTALWNLIAHIQVADAPDRTEPGTGETGWEHLFSLLRDRNYGGWVGCEYRPRAGTLHGLGWLTTLGGAG